MLGPQSFMGHIGQLHEDRTFDHEAIYESIGSCFIPCHPQVALRFCGMSLTHKLPR